MKKHLYIVLFAVLTSLTTSAETYMLTLDSCLEMARRNNPTLRKAQLEIMKAREVRAQAQTKYFPQIQANAFAFHALHPLIEVGIEDIGNAAVRDLLTTLYGNYGAALGLDNTLNLFQHGYAVGVTALQPVFTGGKIVAGNHLAQVGVEAAELQLQMAQRDGLEQVEQSYWLVYGIEKKQQIIDDATELLDTLYRQVSVAVEAGLALPSDQLQIEMKRDEVARMQLQLHSGLVLAHRALALAIGLSVTDSICLSDQPSHIDTLVAHDSTVVTIERRLLDLQLQAAKLQRRMVLADALPHIALGANYSYGRFQTNLLKDGIGSKTGNGALFVTMSVPITGWWETAHKLKQHDYAIEQARVDIDNLGSQLDLRTQHAYDQWVEAVALLQIQERTILLAQETYRQTEVNYKAGLATMAELLQTHTALTQAQSDLTDAQIAVRVTHRRYTDLMRSL